MPPKSAKKVKGKAKEVMLVTSRLMGISLVVDDYIYKNKPISLLEAMKFDEEITSLKIKCNQDTRSLQVIEKLKIFMKSIIKEQSTDRLQDSTSGCVPDTCADDNSLISLNVISEDVENNITNTQLTTTTTEFFRNRESRNSEINNSTQDMNTQKLLLNPVKSLINAEIKQVESNDIITPNNSTSIINDKSKESLICTSKNVGFDNNYCLSNSINEKEQAKSDLATLASSNLQKPPEQEKIYLIQETQKPDEIKIETINKGQIKRKKATKKNKVTAENNIKIKTRKYINKTNKEPKINSSGESRPRKKPKEKVQGNISWIENMKYVREVSPDEHTDLQIEDSFWSNLDLPGICNSNDFD